MKPVLGSPLRIRIDTTDVGETGVEVTDGRCVATFPADGAGNTIAAWTARINGSPILPFSTSYDAAGNRLSSGGAASPDHRERVFPIREGWVIAFEVGGFEGPFFSQFVANVPPELVGVAPAEGFFANEPSSYARAPGGGLATLHAFSLTDGGTGCPEEDPLRLMRLDEVGALAAEVDVGCPGLGAFGVAENLQRDVLAMISGELLHLAPDGTLTRAPFDGEGILQPLIDGSFALGDGRGLWTATVGTDGAVSPPPCWLTNTQDVRHFDIVLGGRAYLLFHDAFVFPRNPQSCDRYAELVLADGTTCGFLGIPDSETCSEQTVSVGLDGTLSTLQPASCTMSVWTGALRGPTP